MAFRLTLGDRTQIFHAAYDISTQNGRVKSVSRLGMSPAREVSALRAALDFARKMSAEPQPQIEVSADSAEATLTSDEGKAEVEALLPKNDGVASLSVDVDEAGQSAISETLVDAAARQHLAQRTKGQSLTEG